MFRDRPCPDCNRLLSVLDVPAAPADRPPVRRFACSACGKEWESCPRCGGLVVQVVAPLDLFRRPPTSADYRCVDCRRFHERRPLPTAG